MQIKLNKIKVGAHLVVSQEFLENLKVEIGQVGDSFINNSCIIAFRSSPIRFNLATGKKQE